MLNKKKILVLGNSPYINDIKFDKIPKNVSTFGVNRIWLKHYPNYFFFQDPEIIKELDNRPIEKSKLISKSVCFTSDWFRKQYKFVPNWIRDYSRQDRRAFPDSITTGMQILHRDILKEDLNHYVFYIAGVSLKWENPSHFWKQMDYDALNKKDVDWYRIRFQKMLMNFKKLRDLGFKMVSVTPNSNINKIMRYESINNLYN